MSSILKKIIVALTGLALVGFLVTHLAGNLNLLLGYEYFDGYAHKLHSLGPLLIAAEVGLLAIFVIHIGLALRLTMENNEARGKGYEREEQQGTGASRFMVVSGVLVGLFVIIHVWMFKFGADDEGGSLFNHVMDAFSNPLIAFAYVGAMFILGSHLNHGFQSVFQTLGLIKPGKREKVKTVCAVAAWAIALGFAALPLFGLVANPKRAPETPMDAMKQMLDKHSQNKPAPVPASSEASES